jgi:hypothetical protein
MRKLAQLARLFIAETPGARIMYRQHSEYGAGLVPQRRRLNRPETRIASYIEMRLESVVGGDILDIDLAAGPKRPAARRAVIALHGGEVIEKRLSEITLRDDHKRLGLRGIELNIPELGVAQAYRIIDDLLRERLYGWFVPEVRMEGGRFQFRQFLFSLRYQFREQRTFRGGRRIGRAGPPKSDVLMQNKPLHHTLHIIAPIGENSRSSGMPF